MGDGVGGDDLEHGRYRDAAVTAAGRVFRLYENHCATPDLDTLHHLLNALHSLNDRFEKAVGRDLHEIDEFIATKVLRNFAHHQENVSANVRVVPTPAQSDLMTMCLVRQDQVDRAIENVRGKWQAVSRAACEKHFHWYGDAVNINPCLFNLVVRIYEDMITFDLAPPDKDIRNLAASYAFEEEHGYSHYVDGTLSAHAGDFSRPVSQ